MKAFDELVQIVARLRGENGCPWDLEQTPESFRPYIIEEAYEVVDAIDRGDRPELKKELGDVLFQIVMLARMAEEAGWFDLNDVVAGINHKIEIGIASPSASKTSEMLIIISHSFWAPFIPVQERFKL